MAEMSCGMNMGNTGMQTGMSGWGRPPMQMGMGGRGQMPGQQNRDGRRGMQMPCASASDTTRQALMKQINEASFAMDDAVLFLDTHPDSAEALQYYRNAVRMRKEALDAYQSQFGPLLVDDVTGDTWSWVTEKWPWEGGY